MVIFNLWAIPVGIVVAIVCGGLTWLFPALGEGGAGSVTYGVTMLLVGGVAELFDIKGRLFFLPMWLIGLGMSAYGAYELFGTLGLVVGAVLLVAALVAFLRLAAKENARMHAEAPRQLEEAERAIANGDIATFWERMRDAYLPPAFGAITPEHARQLGAAVATLEREADTFDFGDELRLLLRAAHSVARRVAEGASSPGFFSKERGFFTEVYTVIGKQGAWEPPEHLVTNLREWQSKSLAA